MLSIGKYYNFSGSQLLPVINYREVGHQAASFQLLAFELLILSGAVRSGWHLFSHLWKGNAFNQV